MITVHCIATATEIVILTIRRQQIINIVIKTLERNKWAVFISFCGMIEHNIKDNLNSVILKRFYHMFELNALFVILALRCIARIWGKKAYCIISPVVEKSFAIYFSLVSRFIELKDRHQLNSCYTKSLQVIYLFFYSFKGSPEFNARGLIHRKASDMHLIYN